MSKKFLVFVSLLVFFMIFSESKTFAAGPVTLTTKDLTIWKIKPNDSTSSSMKILKKSFKQLDFDKVDDGYITGGSTK